MAGLDVDFVLMALVGLLFIFLVAALWAWRHQQKELSERIKVLMESSAESRTHQLEQEKERIKRESEWMNQEVDRIRTESQLQLSNRLSELRERREALEAREVELHRREDDLSQEMAKLRNDVEDNRRAGRRLENFKIELDERENEIQQELERIGGLTKEQARQQVMESAERDATHQAMQLQREITERATKEAENTARQVVITTIQRIAAEQTAESVVSTVELPTEELKGRIIGREGRNIRAFEQITGVNVMIDDTPGSVLISCFDPVRRETARITLTELIADGRIQPARIEEVYERSKEKVLASCQAAADEALATLGITNLHPELTELVGQLKFRTSYGQNVLAHMVECGRIAGSIAAELGLKPKTVVRAAFLHDVGKAIVTSGDGSHALEGANVAMRCGESAAVVNAIASHHNEVPPETVEAVLTQVADTISGSRPGARRESLEAYVHRLERLEEIAASHPGVDRVFAMQAGREVRIMVNPANIDDAGSHALAQSIARQVEEELVYPGNIRITVVRESRATEIAH